jgi:hypothetical protein
MLLSQRGIAMNLCRLVRTKPASGCANVLRKLRCSTCSVAAAAAAAAVGAAECLQKTVVSQQTQVTTPSLGSIPVMSFKFLTPAVRLWPLLLVALLALICITGPTPAEAACKSKRHTSSSRSLLDNNSTTRTTRHATQHSSSRAGGDRGCGTKSPSAEVKNLIRQKLAQADKAKKRRVAATGGGAVGIASTPSSGLQPPAAATIYLVFHIISDVGIAVPRGTPPNTAWHRDPSNPSVGSSAKAGLPTCAHMTGALH